MVSSLWQNIVDSNNVFIIAEAGVNHNGDLALAKKMVDVAKEAGCDAIKFQTFKADKVVSTGAEKAEYQKETSNQKESQLEMIRRLELSETMHRKILDHCCQKDIIFSSSPFDEGSVDFLDTLQLPFFKIPSGEITNLSFVEYIAKKHRPTIISTGMSTLQEVKECVGVFHANDHQDIALLHCLTAYPARIEELNLRAIETLKREFNVPVGFSDHTIGFDAAIAAAALGAQIIEKHFTLDKNMPGPDHQASLNPKELGEFVKIIRTVKTALGTGEKIPAECEMKIASVVRKSVVAVCDIRAGTILSEDCLTVKRPGTGLPPVKKMSLVGRTVRVDIKQDQLISLEMLS